MTSPGSAWWQPSAVFLLALAIGLSCGAIRGQALVGPQGPGNPCGTCQGELSCAKGPGGDEGLQVCLRSCDAGCPSTERCVEGTCQRPCSVVNDCGIRVVEQECRVVGDGGICVVRACHGNADCHGSYLCTQEQQATGCQPVFVAPGYCRRTP